MNINISGKNVEITDSLRSAVEKKVGKLKRYFENQAEVQARLTVERSRHIAEITIFYGGDVLRGEVSGYDMIDCIDQACGKIERQIHKHRTRLEKRMKSGAFGTAKLEYATKDYEAEPDGVVVRRKTFPVRPMAVEDAKAQMELLGHDFFAFYNMETEQFAVLYQRKDGNFGLLEPEH